MNAATEMRSRYKLTERGFAALGDRRPLALRTTADRLRSCGVGDTLAALLDRAAHRWYDLDPGTRDLYCRLAGIDDDDRTG